jgi:putative oxygen-independent coproporphyrinogen III oxidase
VTIRLPPLSLYVHLPWCVRKCPYCDFNSHKAGENAPRSRYLSALAIDLAQEAEKAGDRQITSVFLGGGTPSLFAADEIATIIDQVRSRLVLCEDCEITMEANPGTIEHGRLVEYRQAGINRLSLGAQSFDADILQVLGRIHGPQEIVDAYQEASDAEFQSINIDLMFALPGQDLQRALADVETLLGLAPPHISYYQLTLEPNTVFHQRPPANLPDDDMSWDIQRECHALLGSAGYEQYEISAFAKDGHRCRHNLNYWTFGDYLAIGAGAHGKLTDASGVVWRYSKPANPLMYMEQAASGEFSNTGRPLEISDLGFEYMLNALRLRDGFPESGFRDRTGLDFSLLSNLIETAKADGLMEQVGECWRPTETGFRYLNDLQARFLP